MKIDLNADLGESFGTWIMGQDEALMPYIHSANVACGFHAGDPRTMRRTVRLALEHGVNIGAHPGFPDLTGFGRREIQMNPSDIYDLVLYQLGALHAIVKAEGGQLTHVKPHGALYNMAARDGVLAEQICVAIRVFDEGLILYGLADSELTKAGQRLGLPVYQEVFADRRYLPNGTLMPRTEKGAIIHEVEEAVEQVLRLISGGNKDFSETKQNKFSYDTVCIHGDSKHAVQLAKRLREAVENFPDSTK